MAESAPQPMQSLALPPSFRPTFAGRSLVRPPADRLPGGCYRLRYRPSGKPYRFDGTLRVEWIEGGAGEPSQLRASGDLYYRNFWQLRNRRWITQPGIPWLHHYRYTYYLRVIGGTLGPEGRVRLELELHRFQKGATPRPWVLETAVTAELYPAGRRPSPRLLLKGPAIDREGRRVATVQAAHVSPLLRRADLEIDHTTEAQVPSGPSNGASSFRQALAAVGWELTVAKHHDRVREPPSGCWTEAALHRTMMALRDRRPAVDWRYHLLCVSAVPRHGAWGQMYDHGSDGGRYPREGAAVAALQKLQADYLPASWKDDPLQSRPGMYFWVALHELGRMQGLADSDGSQNHVLSQFSWLVRAGIRLPDGLEFRHNDCDADLLRHAPDPWVRPAGDIGYNELMHSNIPLPVGGGVHLEVLPLSERLPLGAPLRISLRLVGPTEGTVEVPASLSLKDGAVEGEVIDAGGTARTFRPMVRRLRVEPFRTLGREQSLIGSAILLRGPEGFLTPHPGRYAIVVRVRWPRGAELVEVVGRATVEVEAPAALTERAAARKALRTPELMGVLVFGAADPSPGTRALESALGSPRLRPHYAALRARLEAATGAVEQAARWIEDDTLLTGSEIGRFAEALTDAKEDQPPELWPSPEVREMIDILRRRIEEDGVPVEPQVLQQLQALGDSR